MVFLGLHPFGERADVAGEPLRLLGKCRLPFSQLGFPRPRLGRALDIPLTGDQLGEPPEKLPNLFLLAGPPFVGVARLQQREQFAEFVERAGLAGAGLEQLPLLEQPHDRVETVAHLRIPRLLEHAPQQRGPPRIARRQQVGESQKSLFELAKLLRQLLLPSGETAAIRCPCSSR